MASCLLFTAAVCSLAGLGATTAGNVPSTGLPGGYAPAKLTEDVKAAADFAVHEEAKREGVDLKLVSISKAEKQIVAGVNFRLALAVNRSVSTRVAKAVVFRDLKSGYSLTSWEWLGD
jgi:Aspartic acid proteinase inhibitor